MFSTIFAMLLWFKVSHSFTLIQGAGFMQGRLSRAVCGVHTQSFTPLYEAVYPVPPFSTSFGVAFGRQDACGSVFQDCHKDTFWKEPSQLEMLDLRKITHIWSITSYQQSPLEHCYDSLEFQFSCIGFECWDHHINTVVRMITIIIPLGMICPVLSFWTLPSILYGNMEWEKFQYFFPKWEN